MTYIHTDKVLSADGTFLTQIMDIDEASEYNRIKLFGKLPGNHF